MDYGDEINSEEREDYASVDSEQLNNDDRVDKQGDVKKSNSDDQADTLVKTFYSQSLVDVTVTFAFDITTNKLHLSPRGRGRGRSSNKGG